MCPARRLVVEVTESTIMADPKRATDVLGTLRRLGVRLAIDDYGTGYSSLSYLRRLAVDELKIDKSFVLQMGLGDDSDDHRPLDHRARPTAWDSSSRRGRRGPPTRWSAATLGCDRVQGFYHSRPLSAPALEAWLNARRATRDDRLVAELTGDLA